ncbi:MAG: hypothetical protein K2J08_12380 [Ruminococcus sp.]|nr:hypothetical protein [Ruminococcus sp.]
MKKISSFMLACAMAVTALTPSGAVAVSEEELPIMYLTVTENEKISIMPSGDVYINSSELTEDTAMRVNIYVRDEAKNLWNVAPKVKSESSYIAFSEDATDPTDVGENSAYQPKYDFIQSVDDECNTVNIKLSTPMMSSSDTVLTPTGDSTDDFPVAYFNASVDSDIPSGKYRIYFLTEAEDYDGQQTTTVSSILYDTTTPKVKEQRILVSDRKLGDVNNDGNIDSVDASMVLGEYSKISSGGEKSFDESMNIASDINTDMRLDTVDASQILAYYSYSSRIPEGETCMSIFEYLKSGVIGVSGTEE